MPTSNPRQQLTVGQAIVLFLAAQHAERDGDTQAWELEGTQQARKEYEEQVARQRLYR